MSSPAMETKWVFARTTVKFRPKSRGYFFANICRSSKSLIWAETAIQKQKISFERGTDRESKKMDWKKGRPKWSRRCPTYYTASTPVACVFVGRFNGLEPNLVHTFSSNFSFIRLASIARASSTFVFSRQLISWYSIWWNSANWQKKEKNDNIISRSPFYRYVPKALASLIRSLMAFSMVFGCLFCFCTVSHLHVALLRQSPGFTLVQWYSMFK